MQTLYCWWCGKELQAIKAGPRVGRVYFQVLTTAAGNAVYVHARCRHAAEEGQKLEPHIRNETNRQSES